MAVSQKIKNRIAAWCGNPTPGYILKKIETSPSNRWTHSCLPQHYNSQDRETT